MSKVLWYIKQLVPRTLRTRYGDPWGTSDHPQTRLHFVVWRQWLGRSTKIDDVVYDVVDGYPAYP